MTRRRRAHIQKQVDDAHTIAVPGISMTRVFMDDLRPLSPVEALIQAHSDARNERERAYREANTAAEARFQTALHTLLSAGQTSPAALLELDNGD